MVTKAHTGTAKKSKRGGKAKSGVSLELATKVSERVEIQDVRLLAATSRQTPLVSSPQIEVRFSHAVEMNVDRKKSLVAVVPRFVMQAFPAGRKGKEVAVEVEAVFLLTYSISDLRGLLQSHYESFAQTNGVYNAWPYWREYLQNTIIRMGLPSLTVPVFRVGSRPKKPSKSSRSKSQESKKSS